MLVHNFKMCIACTQKVLKCQRTLRKNTKPLHLKGSKFKPFRGLSEDIVFRLLCELSQKKISLAEMAVGFNSRKQLVIVKVQLAFVKGTNCDNWCVFIGGWTCAITSSKALSLGVMSLLQKKPLAFTYQSVYIFNAQCAS